MNLRDFVPTMASRSWLLAALLFACVSSAVAQMAPASSSGKSSSDMSGMDHDSMPGMDMGTPATPASAAKPAPAKGAQATHDMQSMDDMPGMDHASMPSVHSTPAPTASPDAVHHASMPSDPSGDMSGMHTGPMQGGSAPANVRSADYSDGIGYGPMRGMDMHDNAPQSMLLIDQLEAFHSTNANGQSWEAEAWYGSDDDKLWLRTEGERSHGRLDDGDIEALWNHTVASYWSTQLGLRQDLGQGPNRDWAAFGVQGLAPYWFELEATGYVGDGGRTAARFRAQYDVLFTQRLILQPELEVNLYGQSDPARRIGSGLSDARLGLRLRYEISRQFAPYIGIVWMDRYGRTADFLRDDHQGAFDLQWVAGIRFWF
ncbi:copper resistance protein B [Rhodanobacter sp. BL-MT-08]